MTSVTLIASHHTGCDSVSTQFYFNASHYIREKVSPVQLGYLRVHLRFPLSNEERPQPGLR